MESLLSIQSILLSFISGVLTVAAPCSLVLLPVILGGGIVEKSKKHSLVIIGSLSLSILIFSIVLRSALNFAIGDADLLRYLSGLIIALIGLTYLFPQAWDRISVKLGLSNSSSGLLAKANDREEGYLKDILLGAAIGPIFTSCSPTFGIVLAVILPENFLLGLIYLLLYIGGLALTLLLIVLLGQKVIDKLKIFADPHGKVRRILGVLLIVVGLFVICGLDKKFETYLIEQGYLGTTNLEIELNKVLGE